MSSLKLTAINTKLKYISVSIKVVSGQNDRPRATLLD